ncbi:HlyC/CorC family transporter [Robbsia sp. KACC 23696]|uniref:HlyC/CorC family transporter n=1 Tax=Robbsia sp. KACC 23696 TaxID=3149231 RepID=UPI00325BC3EA
MDTLPLWAKIGIIVLLLILSAFFSISETAMMALNRHRLKYLASKNAFGAKRTQRLLAQTEQLLSLILIGNNLINVIIPVVVTSITLVMFGHDNVVLSVTTGVVAFLIIVFCEITPKIVGASFPEKIALPASTILAPLMRIARPLIWLVNLFALAILRMLRINTRAARDTRLTTEEIRNILMESGGFMPLQHRSILMNLFDLDNIEIGDVMVPRRRIAGLDLNQDLAVIVRQLENCQHNKLVVFDTDIDRLVGILHVRKTLASLHTPALTKATIRGMLDEPYFIPEGTPVFQQLRYFQENRKRIGIVVNEYGEVQGLVTPEDIIEELTGEFTTPTPRTPASRSGWSTAGDCIVSGGTPLRELNRTLGLSFPIDGPKTLNGLILEVLTEIPEGNVALKIDDCLIEVVQIDNQAIRSVKLFRPASMGTPAQ